jgi:hypothetical protein
MEGTLRPSVDVLTKLGVIYTELLAPIKNLIEKVLFEEPTDIYSITHIIRRFYNLYSNPIQQSDADSSRGLYIRQKSGDRYTYSALVGIEYKGIESESITLEDSKQHKFPTIGFHFKKLYNIKGLDTNPNPLEDDKPVYYYDGTFTILKFDTTRLFTEMKSKDSNLFTYTGIGKEDFPKIQRFNLEWSKQHTLGTRKYLKITHENIKDLTGTDKKLNATFYRNVFSQGLELTENGGKVKTTILAVAGMGPDFQDVVPLAQVKGKSFSAFPEVIIDLALLPVKLESVIFSILTKDSEKVLKGFLKGVKNYLKDGNDISVGGWNVGKLAFKRKVTKIRDFRRGLFIVDKDPEKAIVETFHYLLQRDQNEDVFEVVDWKTKIKATSGRLKEKTLLRYAATEPGKVPENIKEFYKPINGTPGKEEAEDKRKAEEEAKRLAAEAEAKRLAAEEDKRKAAEEAKRKAAEEAKRKAAEEAKRKAAEEAKRKAAKEAEILTAKTFLKELIDLLERAIKAGNEFLRTGNPDFRKDRSAFIKEFNLLNAEYLEHLKKAKFFDDIKEALKDEIAFKDAKVDESNGQKDAIKAKSEELDRAQQEALRLAKAAQKPVDALGDGVTVAVPAPVTPPTIAAARVVVETNDPVEKPTLAPVGPPAQPVRRLRIDIDRDIIRPHISLYGKRATAETIFVEIIRASTRVTTGRLMANQVHARTMTFNPVDRGFSSVFSIWIHNGVLRGGSGPSNIIGKVRNRLYVRKRSVFRIGYKQTGRSRIETMELDVDIPRQRNPKETAQLIYKLSGGVFVGLGFDHTPMTDTFVFRYLFISNN